MFYPEVGGEVGVSMNVFFFFYFFFFCVAKLVCACATISNVTA